MARISIVVLCLAIGVALATTMVKRQAEREEELSTKVPEGTESPDSNDINPSSVKARASDVGPQPIPGSDDDKDDDDDEVTNVPRRKYPFPHHHHSFFPPRGFGFPDSTDMDLGFRIPIFHFRPVLSGMRRFFNQIFESVQNSTSDLPDNYNNTKTETVTMDGKNYQVRSTVIKKGDNNTSIFVRVLSFRPEVNETVTEVTLLPTTEEKNVETTDGEKELES